MLIHQTSLAVQLGRYQYNFGTLMILAWGGGEVRMAGETSQCKSANMGSFLDAHSMKSHGMGPC